MTTTPQAVTFQLVALSTGSGSLTVTQALGDWFDVYHFYQTSAVVTGWVTKGVQVVVGLALHLQSRELD